MGEPTYETIAALKRCLQSNASSIKCTLGGGQHGYLALIISGEMYATLSNNVPFVVPETPPVEPEIPNGATAAQITEAHCRHSEAQHRFEEYVNVEMALKNQIIANVDIDYLEGAEDTYVSFANKSPRQLLDYLFQDYGCISSNWTLIARECVKHGIQAPHFQRSLSKLRLEWSMPMPPKTHSSRSRSSPLPRR
jgi:hypothetical protein